MDSGNAENPYFFLSGYFDNNGSLWQAVNDSIYPIASSDPGITLNLFPNNSVNIQFTDYGQNLWAAMPIITQLLAPNTTRGLVTCTYPLSGSYDHLPRFLFYITAVLAVVGRRFTWVAEAALGIIIAYSSTAAVHMFVLLGFYRFGMPYSDVDGYPSNVDDSTAFGDIDFFGIAPVVSLTVVLLTPMLQWSKTFRLHRAKVVIQCWAILMFTAAIAYLALIRGFSYSWNFDQVVTVAYCPTLDDYCQPVVEDDSGGYPFFRIKEQYDNCQCNDLCGLLSPKAPIRSGGMVPYLSYAIMDKLLFGKAALENRLPAAETALFSLWIFAIIQGIFALLGSHTTQERIRNFIFRLLYGDHHSVVSFIFRGKRRDRILREHFLVPPNKTTSYWRLRFHVARLVAGAIYLLRIFSFILYPVLFITTFAFCELFASSMPVSEPSSALGAWSAWVGAALVVISAVIMAIFPAIYRRYQMVVNWVRYDPSDRPRVAMATGIDRRAGIADFIQHVVFRVVHFIWELKEKRRQFSEWWADPITHSHPDRLEVDPNAILEPECGCIFCKRMARSALSREEDQPDDRMSQRTVLEQRESFPAKAWQ